MSDTTVFIRAQPQQIKLQETFYYHNEVSRNPDQRVEDEPEGIVQIIVPYDGEQYFTRTAYKDFKRQVRAAGNTQGRLGFLQLEEVDHTDLDFRYHLQDTSGALPLEIPLRSTSLTQDTDLITDRYRAILEFVYTPAALETHPVDIIVSVYDEAVLQHYFQELHDTDDRGVTQINQVAGELKRETGFVQSLIFDFEFRLALPPEISEQFLNGKQRPKLRGFSLEWPFPTSQTFVNLSVDSEEQPEHGLNYDPHQGRIMWGGITFGDGEKQEGISAYIFPLPRFQLVVQQPGELYGKQLLKGTAVIEFPRLVSGAEVAFYNTLGEPNKKPSPEQHTCFVVNFDLFPEDCFADKVSAPYQHIQFEGLILDEMRVADIRKVLEDQGFRIEPLGSDNSLYFSQPDDNDPGALKSVTMHAVRSEGPNCLNLYLQADGNVFTTERERDRYGGIERFTTEVRTGKTEIYVRAELKGGGPRLIQALNEIQQLLKERLGRHIKLD